MLTQNPFFVSDYGDAPARTLAVAERHQQVERARAVAQTRARCLLGQGQGQGQEMLFASASALAFIGSHWLASVPVVLFSLVPNRAHDHVVANDLEENDVARATEWNDQLTRAAVAQFRPAAGVR